MNLHVNFFKLASLWYIVNFSYKADIEKLNHLLKSQLEEVESENVKVNQESDDLISRCQEYQICSADIKEELDR